MRRHNFRALPTQDQCWLRLKFEKNKCAFILYNSGKDQVDTFEILSLIILSC